MAILNVVCIFLEPKNVSFMFTSGLFFLMNFGSESGCQGLEKQAFGKGSIAKISFRRNWYLMIPAFMFFRILGDIWAQIILLPWKLA